MTTDVRFGIVGAGMIAQVIAEAIADAEGARLTAVASRRRETADTFADQHGVADRFDRWEALVAWEGLDAVFVSTPTSVREAVSVAAASHGKHVLAEKPFLTLPSLQTITGACRDAGVAFMDATHFVHHPRTHQLKREMMDRIGGVRAVRSSFFFPFMDRTNIRFDPAKEPTGVIGDMAWYAMRAITEYMPGATNPVSVSGFAERDEESGAVVRGTGLLVFPDGRTSTWDAGYNCGTLLMDLDLLGHTGVISLDDYVLDWAGGFPFDSPAIPVGFFQRAEMQTRGEFAWVDTPSEKPATVRLVEDFVALTRDPAGSAVRDSMTRSEETQGLLDQVWAAVR